jgi:hypothetical protein
MSFLVDPKYCSVSRIQMPKNNREIKDLLGYKFSCLNTQIGTNQTMWTIYYPCKNDTGTEVKSLCAAMIGIPASEPLYVEGKFIISCSNPCNIDLRNVKENIIFFGEWTQEELSQVNTVGGCFVHLP